MYLRPARQRLLRETLCSLIMIMSALRFGISSTWRRCYGRNRGLLTSRAFSNLVLAASCSLAARAASL